MKTASRGGRHLTFCALLLLTLTACSGGGGGGGSTGPYTIGGTVTGLTGSGLVLKNVEFEGLYATQYLQVSTNGPFTFTPAVAHTGNDYVVLVDTQPSSPSQTCVVSRGSGEVHTANVDFVSVTCTTNLMAGACGVPEATGVTAAGPAEGAWGGLFPIRNGTDGISGFGVVAADGQAHVWVGNGEMWIGPVLASSSGGVSSKLMRYERLASGGPGGPASSGSVTDDALGFGTAAAGAALSGSYKGSLSNCQPLKLSYSDVYRRHASLAAVAGVYTVSDSNGYTLTVTIHSDGRLDGSDTLGCVVIGNVVVPDPATNYYSAVADATTCGTLDGHYAGMLSLSDLAARNDNLKLNLSLSKSGAAIFQRLTR